MTKLYYLLNIGMPDRLEEIAQKYNVDPNKVFADYQHRKRVIEEAYWKEYIGRESRLIVNAYKGTINYFKQNIGGNRK